VTEELGRSPELARVILTAFLSSSVRDLVAQDMAEGRRIAGRILKLGQERGDINPKLRTDQMALHLQQTFLGTMLMWSMMGEQKLGTEVEASFQHLCFRIRPAMRRRSAKSCAIRSRTMPGQRLRRPAFAALAMARRRRITIGTETFFASNIE
jgi:hypothetical protein